MRFGVAPGSGVLAVRKASSELAVGHTVHGSTRSTDPALKTKIGAVPNANGSTGHRGTHFVSPGRLPFAFELLARSRCPSVLTVAAEA